MMIKSTEPAYTHGSDIRIVCSAESSPPAEIQWMFNGVYLEHFGPWLDLKKVNESNSGNYRCLFHNKVTSRFASANTTIRISSKVISPKTSQIFFSRIWTCWENARTKDQHNTVG